MESNLQEEVRQAEADHETMRNKRQMTNSQFEDADKKANQYTDMLTQVLKAMKDMRTGITQNLR